VSDTTYQTNVYKKQGGDELVVADGGTMTVESGGTVAVESGGVLTNADGVGAAGAATAVASELGQFVQKTVLTCTAFDLGSFGDEGGQGQYAGAKLYDFPAGLILFLGAVIDGQITLTAPAIDAWDGDIGLGTAKPTDHQSGVNAAGTALLDSTATTQASSKVATVDAISAATALTESGARWVDGTSSAIDLFLNLLVDDNVAHDNTITGTFTGTITFFWINLGDI
jgi:hypothetical protein